MSEMPVHARGRRPRFFEAEGVDELVSMILELTAEMSVLRERQYVTERVLERTHGDIGRAIEGYQLSDADREALSADRERMLRTVLRVLETDSDSNCEDGEGTLKLSRNRAA